MLKKYMRSSLLRSLSSIPGFAQEDGVSPGELGPRVCYKRLGQKEPLPAGVGARSQDAVTMATSPEKW